MSKSEYVQSNILGLPERVSLKARAKMFESLMALVKPSAAMVVLDVGVTCDKRGDSNFFEKMYPYPAQITAIGVEDASFLEKDFPGLKFLKMDGTRLPFDDKSFDLAVSFATIEHVGSYQRQGDFVHELCRVSRQCCITTPNRWHPLEFHSIIPLIHWLPPRVFRFILGVVGQSFYAKEENLNLLTQQQLLALVPEGKEISIKYFWFLGFVSNLMVYIKDRS